MSIESKPRRLRCDHITYLDKSMERCAVAFVSAMPAVTMRREARAAGWVRGLGKDYCPNHGQAWRIRDTGSAFGRTR